MRIGLSVLVIDSFLSRGFAFAFPNTISKLLKLDIISISLVFLAFALCLLGEGINVCARGEI